jgi:hypothetical protein
MLESLRTIIQPGAVIAILIILLLIGPARPERPDRLPIKVSGLLLRLNDCFC